MGKLKVTGEGQGGIALGRVAACRRGGGASSIEGFFDCLPPSPARLTLADIQDITERGWAAGADVGESAAT